MTKRTLLTKISRPRQLNQIEKRLKNFLAGLDWEAKVLGVVADRWVQVDISGEDEGIATNYVAREIGFCPESIGEVKKFATLKGYITELEYEKGRLTVDIGVFKPATVHATVSLDHLHAQLTDGRALELKKISELYGFCKDLPICLKVNELNAMGTLIEAGLATEQIVRYRLWTESLMDRLIVIGATRYEVERALDYAELERDVIDVEPLGIFEQSLTCKLGTDAAGLVSIIGENLRNARFTLFKSRKIIESLVSFGP